MYGIRLSGRIPFFVISCMAINYLRNFVNRLKFEGELKVIDTFVDPVLEIAEYTDRECKQPGGGKALLFTNTGTDFPVVTNIYGSAKRISEALCCDSLTEKENEIKEFFALITTPKDTFAKKLSVLPQLKKISGFFPKVVSGRGECQQVVMPAPDLSKIPVLKTWPYDGGRFVTLPMVITKDPITGVRNVGMYRMQVLSQDSTAMHWHKHKTGAKHYNLYRKSGRKMPVAVAIGGDPVYAYSATAPLPDGIDEFMLAGFLRKKQVKLVKCITQPEIEVPEDADFVIEGYIDPQEELVYEGPFGDHTGFYSLADYYPKFHVTAVTHRKDAIYPATVVGIPPMEDAYIALATEQIFKFPIKAAFVPELEDMHMPVCGVQHNIVIAKINSQFPGNAVKVKNALWGAGQMMFNKILVVCDTEQPLNSYEQLAKECLQNFVPLKDVYIDRGGVSDVLDHASKEFACGGKIMIDVTAKDVAYKTCASPSALDTLALDNKHVDNIDTSLLELTVPVVIVYVKKKDKDTVRSVAQRIATVEEIKIALFVDSGLPANDIQSALWYASGNIDPAEDCFVVENGFGGCLCADATAKTLRDDGFRRQWPEPVVSDSATVANVDRKQQEQTGEIIQSPSQRFKNLCSTAGAVKYINQ